VGAYHVESDTHIYVNITSLPMFLYSFSLAQVRLMAVLNGRSLPLHFLQLSTDDFYGWMSRLVTGHPSWGQ